MQCALRRIRRSEALSRSRWALRDTPPVGPLAGGIQCRVSFIADEFDVPGRRSPANHQKLMALIEVVGGPPKHLHPDSAHPESLCKLEICCRAGNSKVAARIWTVARNLIHAFTDTFERVA